MSLFEILVLVIAIIIVGLYATFNTLKEIKYRNRVRYLMEYEKMPLIKAKEIARQDIFNKKSKKKQDNNVTAEDMPFED